MKKLTWGFVAAAAVALPLTLLGRARTTSGTGEPHGAATARVTRRDIRTTVKATGVIKPMVGAEVKVGSRASGVVERLHVRIGDRVRRGQLLARLDARELTARCDRAVAALHSAGAQLDFARSDLRRKRELADARLLAPGDLELAERAFAVAEQQRAEAEANLALARTQLGYASIRAPIGGVVGSISTQEGETVSASLTAPTFVTLLDLDRLEVWAYVDETDIGRIAAGQKAVFTVDTYPDDEFEGQVTAIYPQAEIRDNVVDYVTVITFATPSDRILRPEMTTTVKIAMDGREDVLSVPRAAVRHEQGRTLVYTAHEGQIASRTVVTGARDDGHWEIVDGLSEGEQVIVGRLAGSGSRP
jgi:macrolide-specific efflux system membrane fusion protein